MNREQAEHLLDAYVRMMIRDPDEAADALREVILDAMTSYRMQTVPGITWPSTTYPSTPTYKPIVTCDGNLNIATCGTGGAE